MLFNRTRFRFRKFKEAVNSSNLESVKDIMNIY